MQALSKQQSRPLAPSIGTLAVLPVFLNLKDKRALVAGGSAAAMWKAELLAAAGAEVHVHAPDLSEEMSALIAALRLVHHPDDWSGASFRGVSVAVADVHTDEAAEAFLAAATRAGVPCNVIDRPRFCQFQFGSIVNRSPVVVGISTDGAAPVLGQAIRRRIEALLPSSLSRWASLAKAIRGAVGAKLAPGTERRHFWEAFSEQAFAAEVPPDEKSLMRAMKRAATDTKCRSLVEIDVTSDDPELLTLKAVRAMQMADAILFDEAIDPAIIELGRREALKICIRRTDCDVDTVGNQYASLRHVVVLRSACPAKPDMRRTTVSSPRSPLACADG